MLEGLERTVGLLRKCVFFKGVASQKQSTARGLHPDPQLAEDAGQACECLIRSGNTLCHKLLRFSEIGQVRKTDLYISSEAIKRCKATKFSMPFLTTSVATSPMVLGASFALSLSNPLQ